MKVIGFVGPKQSGKDTAADILRKSKKSKGKLSFAGPLKDICSKVFDIPPRYFVDPVLKEREFTEFKNFGEPVTLTASKLKMIKRECTKRLSEYSEDDPHTMLYNIDRVPINGIEGRVLNTPREMLQIVGTNFIRDRIFKEWHLRAAFSKEALAKCRDSVYCVTDIRFLNEYEFLKNKFGDAFECYYVERPEAEEKLQEATHKSELEILKVREAIDENHVLKNDGSLEDFEDVVKKVKAPKASSKSKLGSRFIYGPAR